MLLRISFQSIPVSDQDRALAFYRDVLGFELQMDVPYEAGWRWIFLRLPGSDSRIQFAHTDDIVVRDKPVLALVSDDVDADCARWRTAVRISSMSPRTRLGRRASAGPRSATARRTCCSWSR